MATLFVSIHNGTVTDGLEAHGVLLPQTEGGLPTGEHQLPPAPAAGPLAPYQGWGPESLVQSLKSCSHSLINLFMQSLIRSDLHSVTSIHSFVCRISTHSFIH